MADNAMIEQTISDNSYALMELEYFLGLLPDISDLEERLGVMEMKQMDLMRILGENDMKIGEFQTTLGDENSGLVMEINDL
jgi:hypothetical protein